MEIIDTTKIILYLWLLQSIETEIYSFKSVTFNQT